MDTEICHLISDNAGMVRLLGAAQPTSTVKAGLAILSMEQSMSKVLDDPAEGQSVIVRLIKAQ